MGLLVQERAVIRGTIEFANLKEIESTTTVERLFASARPTGWSPQHFLVLPPGQERAFENDQAELRRWLDSIISHKNLEQTANSVAKCFNDTVKAKARMIKRRRRAEIEFYYQLDGVQACYSLAASLLLRPELQGRVGKCHLEGCSNYFFDEREGKSGRRKSKFCSPAHANVDKVRRYRQKNSKKI